MLKNEYDLNRSIGRMADRIAGILDNNAHSIWLYGSVVLGDFRLGWSDIDILALSGAGITERQARQLAGLRQAMLEQEPDNPYYLLLRESLPTGMNISQDRSPGLYTGALPARGSRTAVSRMLFRPMSLPNTVNPYTAGTTEASLPNLPPRN